MSIKIFFFIIVGLAITFFISCGGVEGNIEKYPFNNISPDVLKAALNKVYINHPELVKRDSMYGSNDGENFYYNFQAKNETIIFCCNVIQYSPNSDNIDLSLTTAAVLGQTMFVAPHINFFKKRKFKKIFEQNILPEINEALAEEQQIKDQ